MPSTLPMAILPRPALFEVTGTGIAFESLFETDNRKLIL